MRSSATIDHTREAKTIMNGKPGDDGGIIEIVGSSQVWYDWEDLHGICHQCSGDGVLALTDRASYYPELYPKELSICHVCDGSAKQREEMRFWVG